MSSFWHHFRRAPWELQAFAVFCLLVVSADWATLLFAPQAHLEAAADVGSNPGMGYAFAVILASMLMIHRKPYVRRAILFVLAIQVLYGLFDLSVTLRSPGGSPPHQLSAWQPVWALGVPLAWMAILSTPRLRRWSQ